MNPPIDLLNRDLPHSLEEDALEFTFLNPAGQLRLTPTLYGHLSEDDLIRAFAFFFRLAQRAELANGRALLLFERAAGAEMSLP